MRGLILAGGRSSRMGTDKARISYHGKPQYQHVFDLLTPFCDHVHISCKSTSHFPSQYNPVADEFDFESPLNGILSAMRAYADNSWLTVPVDMPMLDDSLIRYLSDHRDPKKMATCFLDSKGTAPEPLVAIWEEKSFEDLMIYYKDGGISPRNFLINNPVQLLNIPHEKYLVNINTLHEWEVYKKNLHRNS